MNAWLYYSLAVVMLLGGGACWLTNLFSLPGNWLLVGLVALFAWLVESGARGVGGKTIVTLLILAIVGEVIEFAAGAMGAAKHGASRRATLMAILGAVAGSIGGAVVGLPVPLIGSMVAAVLGGSVGAFIGAYVGEQQSQRGHGASFAVGKGAFVGRLWGTVAKLAVGAVMLVVAGVDALVV